MGCGLLAVSTCRKPNTGYNHPATGMEVDRLDPTQRALVLVATGRTTEDNPAEEMQGEHNAHTHPVAEEGGVEVADSQPTPQQVENPTLQAVDAEHQTQAEQNDQDEHQATAILINRNQLVFHSINLFLDFVLELYHTLLRLSRPFQHIFFLMGSALEQTL